MHVIGLPVSLLEISLGRFCGGGAVPITNDALPSVGDVTEPGVAQNASDSTNLKVTVLLSSNVSPEKSENRTSTSASEPEEVKLNVSNDSPSVTVEPGVTGPHTVGQAELSAALNFRGPTQEN